MRPAITCLATPTALCRALLLAAVAVCIGLAAPNLAPTPTFAREATVFTGLVKGVAVGGYDPVAYFTDGKPVAGSATITHVHDGATWRFATEANRAAFIADPAKFAPQYGGYCAWAVSQNYTAKGDPNAWTIHNGKLYLNYDKKVQANWDKNKPGNIAKADTNWPTVLAK